MRHSMNRRNTARCRPHLWQRVYARTPNFGRPRCLFNSAFFAIASSLVPYSPADTAAMPAKGNPSARSSARPSSSSRAVVTIVMSIPRTEATLS